ncbi:MAG: thiamine phosphate synthase [Candidatus Brocadiaceae bacterium]|jgi:thiamine-phosphate pyrophosphorylase
MDSPITPGRMRLYVLLTEAVCRLPWRETVRLLLAGGADVVQLREKDLSDAELLERARELREITRRAGRVLIINDRPDVALLSDADGVHLGQDDLPPPAVREMLPRPMAIGLSTHSPEQAGRAEALGVDYIGVGPVAPTPTKGYREGGGPELVRRACQSTSLPAVAIGGITRQNAVECIRAGAAGVAVCSALCAADDPERAARELRSAVLDAVRQGGQSCG